LEEEIENLNTAYMYEEEVLLNNPHAVCPRVSKRDFPDKTDKMWELGDRFENMLTNDWTNINLGSLTCVMNSDSEEVDENQVVPMSSLRDTLAFHNITEDEFYFKYRDYRPDFYFPFLDKPRPPLPQAFEVQLDELLEDFGEDGLEYGISHGIRPFTERDWKQNASQYVIPWLLQNAALCNKSSTALLPGRKAFPGDFDSIRQAVKDMRRTYNETLVIQAGDYWTSRRIAIHGPQNPREKKDCQAITLAGGPGHVRIWSQFEVGGLAVGRQKGLANVYLTKKSPKPTVMLCGDSQWGFDRCELRSLGGVSLLVCQQARAIVERCGLGGCGKKIFKATNVMSVTDDTMVMVRDCVMSFAEFGGARFYGNSKGIMSRSHVHHIGSYGLLVDANSNVTAWNCTFQKCSEGAITTSVRPANCSLYTGCHQYIKAVEWWGPQRPGTLVEINASIWSDEWARATWVTEVRRNIGDTGTRPLALTAGEDSKLLLQSYDSLDDGHVSTSK